LEKFEKKSLSEVKPSSSQKAPVPSVSAPPKPKPDCTNSNFAVLFAKPNNY
jgi:hypothetical protein